MWHAILIIEDIFPSIKKNENEVVYQKHDKRYL